MPETCDHHRLLFEPKARPEGHRHGPAVDPPSELAQAQAEAAQLQDRDEVMHLDSTLTSTGNLHCVLACCVSSVTSDDY